MPYKDPEQRRKYAREWIARRRSEWFADKTCVRCGSAEDLRLDHIDPRTKVNHRVWSWSDSRREEELSKCQVLCQPCHEEKSIEDLVEVFDRYVYKHGTGRMYNSHGCRCDPCKAAKKVQNDKRFATV